jgi:hypothetical protein
MKYTESSIEFHEVLAAQLAHMADNFRADPLWADMQFGSRTQRIRNYQNMAVTHWEEAQRIRQQQ